MARRPPKRGPVSAHYTKKQVAALCAAMRPLEPGSLVAQLESELAEIAGVPVTNVICTNSCTAALIVAARALWNANTSFINAPALTWPGTYAWAPFFTPTHQKAKLRSLGVPHCMADSIRIDVGYGCAMPLWSPPPLISAPVILDAAHASPRSIDWKWARKHYDAVCLSFYDTKLIGGIRGGDCDRPTEIGLGLSPFLVPNRRLPAWEAFCVFGGHGVFGGGRRSGIPQHGSGTPVLPPPCRLA